MRGMIRRRRRKRHAAESAPQELGRAEKRQVGAYVLWMAVVVVGVSALRYLVVEGHEGAEALSALPLRWSVQRDLFAGAEAMTRTPAPHDALRVDGLISATVTRIVWFSNRRIFDRRAYCRVSGIVHNESDTEMRVGRVVVAADGGGGGEREAPAASWMVPVAISIPPRSSSPVSVDVAVRHEDRLEAASQVRVAVWASAAGGK